jgi:PGF-pre-PGF domain-containing protein
MGLCVLKVDKDWITDRNISMGSITMNRYSDKKWTQLPTSLSGKDEKYLYFTAKTPGFSSFAITGKTISQGSNLSANS